MTTTADANSGNMNEPKKKPKRRKFKLGRPRPYQSTKVNTPVARAVNRLERLVDLAERNFDCRVVHVDNLAPLRLALASKRKKRAIVAYWEQHGYVTHKRLCEIAGVDRIVCPKTWRQLKEKWLAGKIMGRL